MTDDTRDRTEIVGWVLLAVALALVGFCTSSSDAAEQTRHISQDLVIGGTSVTVGRNEAGDICLNWNGDSTTDETWCWDDIDGRFEFTHGQGSLWFAGHTLTLDRNSSKPVIVLSSGGTARAAICTGDSTGDVNDFKIGDGTCNPYWIYVDSTDGQVRIANETATTAIGPKGHLEIEGSVTTEPTLFVRIPDSQTDNGIEIRDSDNSNRTIFDQHGLIGSAEKDGSGNTCDGGDQTGCWKEPMILRSYNADSDGEVGSETEPAFVFQQMDTTNESSGNLVEYRVDVPTTTGEGESGTLSAYMTQGGSQYRDVGGTAYLVADELSDPNWIGTHEFQSPGAVQFEIAPEFETYTVIHETTEPTNPVANTMRMFAIEDASGLPALFLKDTNGDNTQLGCRSASGNPYDEAAPTEYACRVMTRAADGDCRYLALYDDTDSPAVNAFVWVPIAGVGTSCPLQATP